MVDTPNNSGWGKTRPLFKGVKKVKSGGNFFVGGEVVKSDDRYIVRDNTYLNNLVLSSTELRASKATTGHKHPGQEEVYLFTQGSGTMELDDDKFTVVEGDIVLVPDGVFHRVTAGPTGCNFVCVFDGRRDH